jgi:hypothetical protein
MTWEYLGDQGEVSIYWAAEAEIPNDATAHGDIDSQGRPIIAHSESGNHHVLERPVQVRFQPGMDTLYALLNEPNKLIQDCANGHGEHNLPAGIAKFVLNQMYDPFTAQAHRVAD